MLPGYPVILIVALFGAQTLLLITSVLPLIWCSPNRYRTSHILIFNRAICLLQICVLVPGDLTLTQSPRLPFKELVPMVSLLRLHLILL